MISRLRSVAEIKCHILRFYWLIFCQLCLKKWFSRQDWMDSYSQVSQSLRIPAMAFIFHKTYLHKVIATGKFSLWAKYDFYCYILAGNDLFLGGITKPRGMFSLLYASFLFFFFPYKAVYPCAFTALREGYCARLSLALTDNSVNIKCFLCLTNVSEPVQLSAFWLGATCWAFEVCNFWDAFMDQLALRPWPWKYRGVKFQSGI